MPEFVKTDQEIRSDQELAAIHAEHKRKIDRIKKLADGLTEFSPITQAEVDTLLATLESVEEVEDGLARQESEMEEYLERSHRHFGDCGAAIDYPADFLYHPREL